MAKKKILVVPATRKDGIRYRNLLRKTKDHGRSSVDIYVLPNDIGPMLDASAGDRKVYNSEDEVHFLPGWKERPDRGRLQEVLDESAQTASWWALEQHDLYKLEGLPDLTDLKAVEEFLDA